MEGETKKRGREDGEDLLDFFAMKTAKTSKQEIYDHHSDHHQDTRLEESDESHVISSGHYDHDPGKYVGLGVFDFPWLHDDEGMISKSDREYWNFQDTFSSLLDRDACPPEACLYETPTAASPSVNNKLEEINVWPLEGETGVEMDSVDCIWSWMLNQPLQQGHHA